MCPAGCLLHQNIYWRTAFGRTYMVEQFLCISPYLGWVLVKKRPSLFLFFKGHPAWFALSHFSKVGVWRSWCLIVSTSVMVKGFRTGLHQLFVVFRLRFYVFFVNRLACETYEVLSRTAIYFHRHTITLCMWLFIFMKISAPPYLVI